MRTTNSKWQKYSIMLCNVFLSHLERFSLLKQWTTAQKTQAKSEIYQLYFLLIYLPFMNTSSGNLKKESQIIHYITEFVFFIQIEKGRQIIEPSFMFFNRANEGTNMSTNYF